MRENDDSRNFIQNIGHNTTSVGSLAKNFPISETAKALIRVTPYDYHDPWIQDAFLLYDALTPSLVKIIGLIVVWRIFKISALMDNAAKYGKLLRDAVTCYFLLGFFPRIFEILSLQVQDMQERILDFHVGTIHVQNSTTFLEMKPALGVLSILITLASAPFLGPFAFIISGAIALTWALPLVFYGIFHFCFLLGVCVLIFMAPIVIVSATVLEQGIALSIFFWMLISAMIWPLLWAGVGRLAFIGLSDMNLLSGFLFTLGVGVMQCAAPFIFIKMMRGVNPAESILSLGQRIGGTATGMAMGAPIGALAAPALGVMSGARAFMSGSRLGGSAPSTGGFIGRVASGVRAFRDTAQTQSKSSVFPSLSQFGAGGFKTVKQVARAGDHVDRAKLFLRGVNRPSSGPESAAQGKGKKKEGKKPSSEEGNLDQNPAAYSLTIRDLSRYGMLRSAEKQANRWHQGTLAFLSARQASPGASTSKQAPSPSPVKLPGRSLPQINGHSSHEGSLGPIIPMGGPIHPKGSPQPRNIFFDPRRGKGIPKSSHFEVKPAELSLTTPQGPKKVMGYTTYSKKTGSPKAYYFPKSSPFQEDRKSGELNHDES